MITLAPRRTRRLLRGLRGLGDFNPTLCDPRDVACVQKNAAASVAYQQQLGEQQASSDYDRCIANGTDSGTCAARWPAGYSGEVPYNNLTPQQQRDQMMTPDQSQAAYFAVPNVAQELHDFGLSPASLITPTGVYQSNDPYTVTPPVYVPPVSLPPAPPVTPPKPVAFLPPPTPANTLRPNTQVNPQGLTIINSSGAPGTTGSTLALPTVGGFDLSAIPWWGWLGAVGLGYFAFKGGR